MDIARRIRATLKDRSAPELGGLVLTGSRSDLRPSPMAGLPRDIITVVLFVVGTIQDVGCNSVLEVPSAKADSRASLKV
jgi:hypothetical protein